MAFSGGAGHVKDGTKKQGEQRQDSSAADGGLPKPKRFDQRDAPEVSLRKISRAATACNRKKFPKNVPKAGQKLVEDVSYMVGGKLRGSKAAEHGEMGVAHRRKTAEQMKNKVGSKAAEQGAKPPLRNVTTAPRERINGRADGRALDETDARKAKCVQDGNRAVDGKAAKNLARNEQSREKREGDSGVRAAVWASPTDEVKEVGRKRVHGSSRHSISVCALRKLAGSGKQGSADGVTTLPSIDDSEIQRKIRKRLQRHQAKRLKAAER